MVRFHSHPQKVGNFAKKYLLNFEKFVIFNLQFIENKRTTSWGTDKLHTRNPWVRVCDGKVQIMLKRSS